jgi:hypothetical protein
MAHRYVSTRQFFLDLIRDYEPEMTFKGRTRADFERWSKAFLDTAPFTAVPAIVLTPDHSRAAVRQVERICKAAGAPERFESDLGYCGHQFTANKCFGFFDRRLKG